MCFCMDDTLYVPIRAPFPPPMPPRPVRKWTFPTFFRRPVFVGTRRSIPEVQYPPVNSRPVPKPIPSFNAHSAAPTLAGRVIPGNANPGVRGRRVF